MLRRYQALEVIRARVVSALGVDTGLADTPEDLEVVWRDGGQPFAYGAIVRLLVVGEVDDSPVRNVIDYDAHTRTIFRERVLTVQVATESLDHETSIGAGDVMQGILDGLESLPDHADVVSLGQVGSTTSRNFEFQGHAICAYVTDLRFRCGLGIEIADEDAATILSMGYSGTIALADGTTIDIDHTVVPAE